MLVAGATACGSSATTPPPDAGARTGVHASAPIPSEADAMGMALPALRAAYDDTARRARLAEGTDHGVQLARAAAGLARVRALREGDGAKLDDARRLLRTAAHRVDLPGACDASLELARIEARDAADLRAGWAQAHRTEARFGRLDSDAARDCVAEAHRMGVVLASARPSDAEVAALDASDDDADLGPADAGPGITAHEGPTDPQLEAWATAHRLAGETPTLLGVDAPGLTPGARHARVVIRLSAPAAPVRSALARDGPVPRRAVLDFHDVERDAAVPDALAVGAGGVIRVRVARNEAHVVRVVLDLEDDARLSTFVLAAPYRIVIDAQRGDGAAPRDGARGLAVLVLDPGHGGDDHGARSPEGLRESRVALDLAQRVKALLAQRLPSTRVVLTRDRDVFVSLEQRTAVANAAGADAFVSIHLNASPTPAERGGVGTFVLDTTDDTATLALAARENGTTEAELSGLTRLLASVERADQARGARALADAIQGSTLAAGRRELPSLGNRGVQAATFYVLVGTEMPAVLVEASFILRAPEAPLLARESYRQHLAEGIAEGIVQYAAEQ